MKRNKKFEWTNIGHEILLNKNRSDIVNRNLIKWIDGLMHYINYSQEKHPTNKPIRSDSKDLNTDLWCRGWQTVALEVKRLEALDKRGKLKDPFIWANINTEEKRKLKDNEIICAPWN